MTLVLSDKIDAAEARNDPRLADPNFIYTFGREIANLLSIDPISKSEPKIEKAWTRPHGSNEPVKRTGPISPHDLRREYYAKAGVSAQWVQEQLYGKPGDHASFSGDSLHWSDKQTSLYRRAESEQDRYNVSSDLHNIPLRVSPLTARIIRANRVKWAQSGRFPNHECKLAYNLALNCARYQRGEVDEATAREKLDGTIHQWLREADAAAERQRIAQAKWEAERPIREARRAVEETVQRALAQQEKREFELERRIADMEQQQAENARIHAANLRAMQAEMEQRDWDARRERKSILDQQFHAR